jgi:hypothetical protein
MKSEKLLYNSIKSAKSSGFTIGEHLTLTGLLRSYDLGLPDRIDVYYGMADDRIGAARLDVPGFLPPGGVADPPEAKV